MICTCSLGRGVWFFTIICNALEIRMNFELRGWPQQPPTFSWGTYMKYTR